MSNQKKHTAEPWEVCLGSGLNLCTAIKSTHNDRLIADVCPHYFLKEGLAPPVDEQNANLTRIVQCVNACADMPDPATEIAAMRSEEKLMRVELVRQTNEIAKLKAEIAQANAQPASKSRRATLVSEALANNVTEK